MCLISSTISAMRKITFLSIFILLSAALMAKDCVFVKDGKEFPLHGKVQIVEAFPDLKVQIVEAHADLEVKLVEAFPDDCGEVQLVEAFPDVKIQIVEAFPDLKVKIVNAFPRLTASAQRATSTTPPLQ